MLVVGRLVEVEGVAVDRMVTVVMGILVVVDMKKQALDMALGMALVVEEVVEADRSVVVVVVEVVDKALALAMALALALVVVVVDKALALVVGMN